MAEGLNRAMLLGNLGADPELRYTGSGTAVLNLRLATTETFLDKDKNRQERTDWHNVIIWGKRGEALAKILTKGASIFIEGSIRTSSYDDQDGNKRYKTEIVAANVILNGGGKSRTNGGAGYGRPPEGAPVGGQQKAPVPGVAGASWPTSCSRDVGGQQKAPVPGVDDDIPGGGYGGSADDIPF